MNYLKPADFIQPEKYVDFTYLEKTCEPALPMLAQLIQEGSPAPETRTAMTTALVLTLWQQRGDILTDHVPSMILLNAGGGAKDPIDHFIDDLTQNGYSQPSNTPKDRNGIPFDPEKALLIMQVNAEYRSKLGPTEKLDHLDARSAKAAETRYHDVKRFMFGNGPSLPYTQSWCENLNFVTDRNGVRIARISEEADRLAFRRDLRERPNVLRFPQGIGKHWFMSDAKVSFSGSISEDGWDEEIVTGVIELGLPILFIPHLAHVRLVVPNPGALTLFASHSWNNTHHRARTSLEIPPLNFFHAHTRDVRRRLRSLPGHGTYEFAVLQVLHQLGNVCKNIAACAAETNACSRTEFDGLFLNLHMRAYRGVALGVAALAWHCLGFNPGCPRKTALKVLKGLRTRGPMTYNEVRRNFHLESQEQRDLLLQRLANEDLVRIEGKTVTAATFTEFVTALHGRKALPPIVENQPSS